MIDQLPSMHDPSTVTYKRKASAVMLFTLIAWLLFGCAFYMVVRWTRGN